MSSLADRLLTAFVPKTEAAAACCPPDWEHLAAAGLPELQLEPLSRLMWARCCTALLPGCPAPCAGACSTKRPATRYMVLWARSLEADWSAAVHRLERVRNSIMHDGPFTDAAVTRVHSFSQQRVTVRNKHIATAHRMDAWRQVLSKANPHQAVFVAS